MTRMLLHVLLRASVLIAFSVCVQQGVVVFSDDALGNGLSAFLAFAVIAGAWGAVDGWLLPVGRIAVIWPIAGTLLSVGSALGNALPGRPDFSLVLSDVLSGLPIYLTLVAAPAIAAGAVVAAVRPRRPALPR